MLFIHTAPSVSTELIATPDGGGAPFYNALLVERFQLKFHQESKQTAVYALVIGNNGPKMKERKPDDAGEPFSLRPNGLRMSGRNASMSQLADILQSLIPLTDPERANLPVVDKTGLTGNFDFDLRWAPEPTLAAGRGGAADSADAPDLLIAVQEQLGLKLEMQKAPMEVLIIDHAERTEN